MACRQKWDGDTVMLVMVGEISAQLTPKHWAIQNCVWHKCEAPKSENTFPKLRKMVLFFLVWGFLNGSAEKWDVSKNI